MQLYLVVITMSNVNTDGASMEWVRRETESGAMNVMKEPLGTREAGTRGNKGMGRVNVNPQGVSWYPYG